MKNFCLGFLMIILITVLGGCNGPLDKEPAKKQSGLGKETLIGTWSGVIKVPNQQLNIIVHFTNDDPLDGTISIPVQNVEDFSLSDITVDGSEVSFSIPISGQSIHFTGKVENQLLSGTFSQAGQSYPFELEKGKTEGEMAEGEEFLTIETYTGALYGALLTPEKGEKHPVALIIPGSGPTDRNGNSPANHGENNSLKLLAEALADQGVASLRYDKRGAGKNAEAVTAKQEGMRFEQFVNDAVQWLNMLEEDQRFKEIVVIGHSQGSLVGMIAAEEAVSDAFISIEGAGRTIDQVLSDQLAENLPKDLYEESRSILDQLREGKTVDQVSNPLRGTFNPSVQPFLLSWMKYDPVKQMSSLDIPTLIVNGTNDVQVPIKDAQLLAEAKPDAELMLVEEMNHVLKKAPASREGNLATYGNPDLPLAEGLMPGIVKFLKENGIINE